jgi:hypothetical protein
VHPGRVPLALMMKKELLIGAKCYSFTFTEKHICHLRFCESTEQGPEQSRRMFVRNIFSWSNRSNIGTAPFIYFAVTPRLLRPKEHKINKSSFNV